MDEAFGKQAAEWFERGRHDIETAQLLFDEKGYADSIALHIQQALEKYLKGFLVLHGRKPPRIHELDALLNRISEFDNRFDDYISLCEKATRYYLEDRYPPGPLVQYEYEELKEDLRASGELIQMMMDSLNH